MDKPDAVWYKARVIEIRNEIRGHRDAKGDDRCWLDDYLIWKFLPNQVLARPSLHEAMRRCRSFYHLRRTDNPDPIPKDAILDRKLWDEDLEGRCRYQLADKIGGLVSTINHHYDTSLRRELTVEDDRHLYTVLPEKLSADFRLPPEAEFLGQAKAGAGCPNFWNSHARCGQNCSLHQWGPCA